MAKIYKRIGLRRDKNLGDLSNAKTALNNLLDAFAETGDDENATFISEDLDCIRNIFAEGMTPSTYQQIGGSALESTTTSGENKLQKPRVTYINRLDIARVFAGEPRIYGGNGLTASYYDKDRVFEDTIGIWSGTPFKQDNFWENGSFEWTRKIHPSAADENGGIEWEGWFIPTQTGLHGFRVNTSGCFTAEFETEGYTSGIGTYVEHAKVGIASTAVCTGTSGQTTIAVSNLSDMKNIGIGHSVVHTNIADDTSIEEISGQTLTLKSSNSPIITSNINGAVTFSRAVGQETTKTMNPGYVLQRAQRYRIRFRYFVPQTRDASRVSRSFEVDFIRPTGGDDHLRFTELYGLDYDFSDAVRGDFSKYLDTSVLFGGGTIGLNPSTKADPGNESDYVTLKSTKKVDIRYTIIDKGLSYAERKTLNSVGTTAGSNIISTSDTSNIEVGNYIYDISNTAAGATRAFTDGTRVSEIVINRFLILSSNANVSGSNSFKIVDHRGHVQRVVGNSPAGNSQVELTTDYPVGAGTSWTGRILIGPSINTNSKIALNGTTSSVGLNYSVGTISSLQSMYIYESDGLVNNSLTAFCTPKTGSSGTRCVSVTSDVASNATTLPVSSTTDITQGDTVLGFYFSSGTTVSSIDTARSTITINQGTTDIIKTGNNFTITRDSGDRSLCCPPKDTSPPFAATEEGMITKDPRFTVEIDSGNVLFGDWSATVNNSLLTTDTSTVPSGTYNKEIPINCNGTTYKILAV